MSVIWAIAIVWLAALIGILIMKKIQPDSYKAYAVYAVVVGAIFTLFVSWYIFYGK